MIFALWLAKVIFFCWDAPTPFIGLGSASKEPCSASEQWRAGVSFIPRMTWSSFKHNTGNKFDKLGAVYSEEWWQGRLQVLWRKSVAKLRSFPAEIDFWLGRGLPSADQHQWVCNVREFGIRKSAWNATYRKIYMFQAHSFCRLPRCSMSNLGVPSLVPPGSRTFSKNGLRRLMIKAACQQMDLGDIQSQSLPYQHPSLKQQFWDVPEHRLLLPLLQYIYIYTYYIYIF